MKCKKLEDLLPEGYEQACYDTKAIQRKKTIKTPLSLLILILYYLSGDKSLVDVSQFAFLRGIGKISDTGFLKRFVNAKEWIIWLNGHILSKPIIQYRKPDWLKEYTALAIDASDVSEKGMVKRLWHLHYAVDLFSMRCNQFKITAQSTGESLKNFSLQKGHLVLADRVYGTITSMVHCLDSGADFILRIKNKAFDLYDSDGEKIVLSDWLKNVGEEAEELPVFVKAKKNRMLSLRICAVKKPLSSVDATEKRLKRQQSKKQISYSDDTIFTHKYFFVITSLPNTISAQDILACYRLRWQVELVFKRLKSLLGFGSIPTKTAASSETWINGKMLLALLIETYQAENVFPPSESFGEQPEHLERGEMCAFLDLLDASANELARL